jgi:hypothetical protein
MPFVEPAERVRIMACRSEEFCVAHTYCVSFAPEVQRREDPTKSDYVAQPSRRGQNTPRCH